MRVALLLALWLGACDNASSDDRFRTELLARVVVDQAIRDTFTTAFQADSLGPALVARMRAVDSANTVWLAPRLRRDGFPTRARIGKDGVSAAFLLIQHADWNPAFQAEMLPLIERAWRAGDLEGQEMALLTDRVLKAQGKPQRYGTQTTAGPDGEIRVDPIEDSAGVDARRKALGLPSLAEYKRVLDSVYGRKQAP